MLVRQSTTYWFLKNGCTDSVYITVLDTSITFINATSCDSYYWNGTTYTSPGVYIDTLINSAGCDSITTLNLTINNNHFLNKSIEICTGDSVVIGSSIYTSAGIYIDTLISNFGCDSIITTSISFGQLGCTDPTALNYDLNATCDNSTCIPFYMVVQIQQR